ncbi:MAG: amidase family protein [Ilumatobacteraceae bacterium]
MWKLGARMIGAAVSVSDEDQVDGLTHQRWLRMDRERAGLRAAWAALFERFDVVLCPVAVVPAFRHLQEGRWDTRTITVNGRERRYTEIEGWPALVGAAYLPSTSTPVGRTAEGLPVGMQVVAPFLHDRRAIAVADALTRTIGGYANPPIVLSP